MALHLLKMAVGAEDISDIARLQSERLERLRREGEAPVLRHVTRNMPRRAEEILGAGSLYWVMSGAIRARQRILDFQTVAGRNGRPRCAIVLDPELHSTETRPYRPFRGWRYLPAESAPPDRPEGESDLDVLPPVMLQELRRLGLV